MTNRVSSKKVVKNTEKPQRHRKEYDIIKHFEPSIGYAACRTNLNAQLPEININIEDEPKVSQTPKKPAKSIKKPPPTTLCDLVPVYIRSNRVINSIKGSQKTIRKQIEDNIKSTSSSSLEMKLEKFTNKCRVKSKSFHAGSSKRLNDNQKVLKNLQGKSSASGRRPGSLKSATDPALVQRDIKVQSLKQEIVDNKKNTMLHRGKPDWFPTKTGHEIQKLKDEIFQSKVNNTQQKKILITELKSEVALYKQINNFFVYNAYNGGPDQDSEDEKNSRKSKHPCPLSPNDIVPLNTNNCMEEKYEDNNWDNNVSSESTANEAINREPNVISIEKETTRSSTAETSDRLEESYRPKVRSNDLLNLEYLDDEVIKNKIKEANHLIDRVKKALHKIKIAKSGSQSEEGESGVSKSNSTDIEETISNLKREAAQLITDDLETVSEEVSKVRNLPSKPSNIQDQTFIKAIRKPKNLDDVASNEDTNPSQTTVEGNDFMAVNENEIEGRISYQCCGEYVNKKNDFNLERPKTRRSEAADDLLDQVHKDKFRTSPEDEHLNVSTSLEELQAKLQTISESTESTYSTPRKKSTELQANRSTKYCNTDLPKTENKEIQVEPAKNTTGICCEFPREDKIVQTNIRKNLTKEVQIEYYSPNQVGLEKGNCMPQDITSLPRNCSRCQVEFLPIIELLPCREKVICDKCRMDLKEEHVGGVSIHTNLRKLQRLHIQVLPPIIIKPAMILTQVLDLSIDPNGKCENRIINTRNVGFMELINTNENIDDDTKGTANANVVLDDNQLGDASGLDGSKKNEEIPKVADYNRNDKEETMLKEIELLKNLIAKRMKQNSLALGTEPPISQDEKDIENKALWYKSYHLYDNPNKHDPGPPNEKSLEKLSHIDFQFYKNFINPNTKLSKEYFTPTASTHKIAGFESKMVQCDESMLLSSEECVGKETLLMSDSPNQDEAPQGLIDFDSQITVLKLRGTNKETNGEQPKQTDSSSSLSEITVTISYAFSEDRLNNTANSNRNILKVQESAMKPANDVDLPSKSEQQVKLLPAVDKGVIFKMQEKLKSVDTRKSEPKYTVTRNSTNYETIDNFLRGLTDFNQEEIEYPQERDDLNPIGNKDEPFPCDTNPPQTHLNNEPDENNDKRSIKKHTVNYMFNEGQFEHPYIKHLELGKNGRYKDEENMFTQAPYPIISSSGDILEMPPYNKKRKDTKLNCFDRKDKELANDKLVTIPRHKLKRYSPDISYSDTVTTSSVSEGEILCKHAISNGEIHICRHHPQCPRLPRNILTKNNFTVPLAYRLPHKLTSRNKRKKFDLGDPKVTIEHRRNYFNNWVTYYVRPQDMNESSTSSCTNNK